MAAELMKLSPIVITFFLHLFSPLCSARVPSPSSSYKGISASSLLPSLTSSVWTSDAVKILQPGEYGKEISGPLSQVFSTEDYNERTAEVSGYPRRQPPPHNLHVQQMHGKVTKMGKKSPHNEDTLTYHQLSVNGILFTLCGVFDGHGVPRIRNIVSPGRIISEAVRKESERFFYHNIRLYTASCRRVRFLEDLFAHIDRHLRSHYSQLIPLSGTTLTMVLVVEDSDDVTIYGANMGDSRGIIGEGRMKPSDQKWIRKEVNIFTQEQNLREKVERKMIIDRLKRLKYVGVPSDRPGDDELYLPHELHPSEDRRYSKDKLLRGLAAMGLGAKIYSLDPTYLRVAYPKRTWVQGEKPVLEYGLQVTCTLGDISLEPVKRHSLASKEFVTRVLSRPTKGRNVGSLVFLATDGFWEPADALFGHDRKKSVEAVMEYYVLYANRNLLLQTSPEQGGEHLWMQEATSHLLRFVETRTRDDITILALWIESSLPSLPPKK